MKGKAPAPERGFARGKAARKKTPRSAQAHWKRPDDRPDPLALLRHDDEGRLPELLPLRYARMVASPFGFFRGAASIMASDLQFTPSSGITAQICGDAHLANFGGYASPERRFVFDVNDFDETTVGAWEWDLKRLCSSCAIAGQHCGLRSRACETAVRAAARSYRERIAGYAAMRALDLWYARIEEKALADVLRAARAGIVDSPAEQSERLFPSLVSGARGSLRIADRPPRIFHATDPEQFNSSLRAAFKRYRRSLAIERRALFDRFTFVDAAYKVVGVGSVGTHCAVALFVAGKNDPLFLQIKEARNSVYAPYVGASPFADNGERVVAGQRLMQATSDLLLGWMRGEDDHTYYVRQLRDMKTSANIEAMSAPELTRYAELCGWALARAHAKSSGDPAAIAGYLGTNDAFDDAMVAFAHAYAEQNAVDHAKLVAAVDAGRIVAQGV